MREGDQPHEPEQTGPDPPPAIGAPAPGPTPSEGGLPSDSRNLAMLAHLSTLSVLIGVPFGNILGPLIVWLIKRQDDPFVERHAREALNFNLSLMIYGLVLFVGGLALLVAAVGLALLVLAVVYAIVFFFVWLVLSIVAAVTASRGAEYRYPFTLRLVS